MIIKHLIQPTSYGKLVAGSVVVALAVSLGTVISLRLFGFEITAALPSALAAVAAATYAASGCKTTRS